jgi:hypothetical protein
MALFAVRNEDFKENPLDNQNVFGYNSNENVLGKSLN